MRALTGIGGCFYGSQCPGTPHDQLTAWQDAEYNCLVPWRSLGQLVEGYVQDSSFNLRPVNGYSSFCELKLVAFWNDANMTAC